nr:MAG TPA: hypothetical protein [Caudoviricetes sp.]
MFNTQGIQYVNGIESANAYRIFPNQQVILMDSTRPRFYLKTSDASGFSTVKAFDFMEVQEPKADIVNHAELDELKAQIMELSETIKKSLTDKGVE